MKYKQASLTLTRTVNLGDFESFKVEVGMVADVDEGEEWTDEQYEELSEQVREYMQQELAEGLRVRNK